MSHKQTPTEDWTNGTGKQPGDVELPDVKD